MKRILITGIGGDIGQCVATILRESRPEIQLFGTDSHLQHGGHLFVDHFSLIPNAISSDYLIALNRIIEENKINAIIPMSEPEVDQTKTLDQSSFLVKLIAEYRNSHSAQKWQEAPLARESS